jgi:hypothetical protein
MNLESAPACHPGTTATYLSHVFNSVSCNYAFGSFSSQANLAEKEKVDQDRYEIHFQKIENRKKVNYLPSFFTQTLTPRS